MHVLDLPPLSIRTIDGNHKQLKFSLSSYESNVVSFFPLVFGLTTTFISSLFAIDFLLKYFSSNGLKLFIIYRIVFGVVILLNL